MPQTYKDRGCHIVIYCDTCRTNIDEAAQQAGFHRCDKCDYDICVGCIAKPEVAEVSRNE